MNRFRLTFVLLALLVATLWGGSALAASPSLLPTWATWELETAFVNGQVQAGWTVIVGGEDAAGLDVELVRTTHPISCWVDGAVTIGSTTADFQGGIIKCSLPNFALAANELIEQTWGSGHELALDDLCECRPTEKRSVEALVLPTGTGSNPIFHHPNLLLAAPGEGGYFANYLAAAGQTSTSKSQKVKKLTSVRSDHLCSSTDSCKFAHYRAGQVIDMDYQNFVNAVMYTGETTVYLGGNPNSGERFYGQMGGVQVDPGCRMD